MKTIVQMKRKVRNILFVVVATGAAILLYARHNFENDKQILLSLKSKAGAGDLNDSFEKMEEIESLSNPIMNAAYQNWKSKMTARFITQDEIIENTSGNKTIHDVSNIYREYWRSELLKRNPKTRTDTLLYETIINYLLSNGLTTLTRDSLELTVKNDNELRKIIEGEGFKTKFMYRNGFQDLIIWGQETTENYEVVLPKDTIKARVVFMNGYQLNGFDDYASMGSSKAGGWAIKESATLYCNEGEYNTSSEHFHVSYLKHESLHFSDLNEYPNLSSADLEYRAKIIELMYCTDETVYDRLTDFINGASIDNREHAHPYANYLIISDLSKELFNSEFESDYSKWKEISPCEINKIAALLYENNEAILQADKSLSEVI